MTTLLLVALILGLVALGLCYAGRGWLGWVVPGALFLGWWYANGAFAPVFWPLAALFALAALLLAPTPLRRALVSPRAMKLLAPILPQMSETERIALDAGTVWFDRELFSGAPDWRALLEFRAKPLSPREQAFLDGPATELCRMVTEHQVAQEGDLTPEQWEFLKGKKFVGMIIPESYGGLGFSALAHSAVITKLSSRCTAASVTAMVPNSLGPAELLLHYGTDEQKRHYLPRLANGEEIPCFALTEPLAGSDAAGIQATGTVCRGEWGGREIVGMRLEWNKRYITLAPVATVLGLAFHLRDPDHLLGERADLGITCALIPAHLPGIEIGERHDPLGVPFHNGPTRGSGVFVPLDSIIGGPAMAGKGWLMLMQCLAAGRGISLPSLSAGATQLAARTVGAYATVREQFGLPIGRFEGVEEPLARIGGLTYLVNAARVLTVGSIDAGEKPSVLTAIAKRYSTEAMRTVINDAMDIVGGAGISRGPRNVLAPAYAAIPIGITVEGANILTRSMIVFGQGALRCHPFAQDEVRAVAERDVALFDKAFFGHVGFVFRNASRSLVLGLTGAKLCAVPRGGEVGAWLRQLTRFSAAFAFVSDVCMGTLGGDLKRKEMITGRLADALSWMYLASATLKRFADEGEPELDRPLVRWAMRHSLHEVQTALDGLHANFPLRPAAWAMRAAVFPLGARLRPPSDRIVAAAARALLDGGEARRRLTRDIYVPEKSEPGLGELERALDLVVAARPANDKIKDALKKKALERKPTSTLRERAVQAGVISATEKAQLEAADQARWQAVQVDSFEREVYAGMRR